MDENQNVEIYAQRKKPWDREGVELRLMRQMPAERQYASSIVWNHIEEEFGMISPVMMISDDRAQYLMDQLWDCGFRPTQDQGKSGILAATERHLADLQRLVFFDKKPLQLSRKEEQR